MTGIHYDDLTQIHTVFGLLDEDTQKRLSACKRVEMYISLERCWRVIPDPGFYDGNVYRQAPPVERPIDVDHHALGPGVYCWARDEDNDVYAYNYDPKERDGMWCYDSGEGTPCAWLLTGLALLRDPGEGDWRKSKVINPLWRGEQK